jgi:hypothetical protein
VTTIDDIRASMREVRAALADYEREVANDTPTPPPTAAEFRRKSHAWLNRAQGDVEFLLGIGGTRVERSTFGAMLEQAELYSFARDSHGVVRPVPPKTSDCVPVKHQRQEPGYDLDFETMGKLGRANRLLDAVGRRAPILRYALEAYHGDRGERWGRPYKEDNSGGIDDRAVSLYPLTPMGRKWVTALRAKYPISGELRADEVLAQEVAMHRRAPIDDMRRQRLSRCAQQARALLEEAHAALAEAAQEQADTARCIRRASRRAIA